MNLSTLITLASSIRTRHTVVHCNPRQLQSQTEINTLQILTQIRTVRTHINFRSPTNKTLKPYNYCIQHPNPGIFWCTGISLQFQVKISKDLVCPMIGTILSVAFRSRYLIPLVRRKYPNHKLHPRSQYRRTGHPNYTQLKLHTITGHRRSERAPLPLLLRILPTLLYSAYNMKIHDTGFNLLVIIKTSNTERATSATLR